jgi:hypothetical protein
MPSLAPSSLALVSTAVQGGSCRQGGASQGASEVSAQLRRARPTFKGTGSRACGRCGRTPGTHEADTLVLVVVDPRLGDRVQGLALLAGLGAAGAGQPTGRRLASVRAGQVYVLGLT